MRCCCERLLRRGGLGRLRAARGLLEAVRPAELLAEPLHATSRVDELLLTGEERVAGRADIYRDPWQRAPRLERVPARAVDVADLIFRMNFRLHEQLLSYRRSCEA